MEITSFYFLCCFTVSLLIYYVIPKKAQWAFLLLLSVGYFLTYGNPVVIGYPVAAILVTYLGANQISHLEEQKTKKTVLSFVVLFDLAILLVLKYLNFGIFTHNAIIEVLHLPLASWERIRFLIPLGLSYYTLSIIGYVVDVYWGLQEPQKNVFKFALYGMYFPVMISGPVTRYKDMEETLFEKHTFNYQQVTFGFQRILWGFFKKLVISERLAVLISTVYNDYQSYPGAYIVVATIAFAFRLYTDFSGCMDIIIGVSQCFGVKVRENFQTPFFSKSMQEFWRRWHISIGVWLKDYLFYPLLRTKFFMGLPKKLKVRFGKKAAKQITTFSAMFVLWFTIGLWHGGGWKYIIGSGLLHWFYIVGGEVMEPVWKKMRAFMERVFHVGVESKGFQFFQMLRTFLLVCSGFLFFNSGGMRKAFSMYHSIFTTWNPQILWNGSLLQLGLPVIDCVIVVMSLIILFVVSCLQQKQSAREWLAARPLVVRWILLYALLFYVILLGNYGPGYTAAEFIYAGF